MKVQNYESIEKKPVTMEGSEGCQVRWLIGSADSAPNFAMRQFEVATGGHTPRHFHPYEHEVFVLEGEGEIFEGDKAHPLKKGDVVYVAPNEVHQFRNLGATPLKFLCLVPNSSMNQPVTMAPECGVEAAK
jgi:quercetin dioxygenase-like cupin family protein